MAIAAAASAALVGEPIWSATTRNTGRSAATPAGRVGDPKEFGDACAFLCAASSGFIVGQNLLLDGGAFNSTMG